MWAAQALLLAFALKLKVSAAAAADGPANARLGTFQVRLCHHFSRPSDSAVVSLFSLSAAIADMLLACFSARFSTLRMREDGASLQHWHDLLHLALGVLFNLG